MEVKIIKVQKARQLCNMLWRSDEKGKRLLPEARPEVKTVTLKTDQFLALFDVPTAICGVRVRRSVGLFVSGQCVCHAISQSVSQSVSQPVKRRDKENNKMRDKMGQGGRRDGKIGDKVEDKVGSS